MNEFDDWLVTLRWSPIETAPKDGTPILVYAANEWGQPFVTVEWSAFYGEWHLLHAGAHAETSDWYAEPTHWMPLPPPPVTK